MDQDLSPDYSLSGDHKTEASALLLFMLEAIGEQPGFPTKMLPRPRVLGTCIPGTAVPLHGSAVTDRVCVLWNLGRKN